MALDFSSYATPARPPDFSMFAIQLEDGAPQPVAPMLRNAKGLERFFTGIERTPNEQALANEIEHLGPLFIAGNAKTFLPLLAQHGIVLAIGTDGGVKVGRTQARQAHELLHAGVLGPTPLFDQYARARANGLSGEQP
jgi:hypothetical protein